MTYDILRSLVEDLKAKVQADWHTHVSLLSRGITHDYYEGKAQYAEQVLRELDAVLTASIPESNG